MLNQHYQVGNKKFYNYYSAINETKQTRNFANFVIPDLQKYNQVDYDKVYSTSINNLIKEKLLFLKKQNAPIRLHYSGGSDSHAILKCAEENNIFLDSVFVYLSSIHQDEYVNYEFIPGLKYLEKNQQLYKKIELYNYTIDDYMVWFDSQTPYKYTGFYHGFRPVWQEIFCKNLDTQSLEITGIDKPTFYIGRDGNFYWILHDQFDYIAKTYHCDFFLDYMFPELAIKQVIESKKYLEKNIKIKKGWINHSHLLNKQQKMHNIAIGRQGAVHKDLDNTKSDQKWKTQSYLNKKHIRALIEIYNKNKNIVDVWIEQSYNLVNEFKNVPHGIEIKTVSLPNLQGIPNFVDISERVRRVGAIFKVTDVIELMPFTDIQKL